MSSYVMRIWLPDRPGALGFVAGRIGAAGGDLVGIDILERGEGRVIDELTIELESKEMIPQLLRGVSELEGVDVEDIRSVVAGLPHPIVDPLEVAGSLLIGERVEDLLSAFVAGTGTTFNGWAVVVDPDGPVVLAATPEAPTAAWLNAFVTGTRAAASQLGAATAASDIAWASLEISGLALLVGRPGRPFRSRERRQLATLSRIADHRWRELVVREGRRAHPANRA